MLNSIHIYFLKKFKYGTLTVLKFKNDNSRIPIYIVFKIICIYMYTIVTAKIRDNKLS